MSYSRSTFRSSSTKYSEDVSDDSFSRTSVSSALRTSSRFDTGDTLSSIRRSSRPTYGIEDDDDDIFQRSRRPLRSRIEDDTDSGFDSVRRTSRLTSRDEDDTSSVRRSYLTSRLSSRDEDDSSSVHRSSYLSSRSSTKDEDDTASVRRSYLTGRSSIKDEDDVSSVRRSYLSKRSSKDEEDNVSIRSTKTTTSSFDDDDSKSFRKTTRSSTLSEDDNSLSYRKSKLTSSYDVDGSSSVMAVKSSQSSISYERDDGVAPLDSISKRIMSKSESFSSESESKIWKYFGKLSNNTAKCNKCSKVYKSSGNTSNFALHLRRIYQIDLEGEELIEVDNGCDSIWNLRKLKPVQDPRVSWFLGHSNNRKEKRSFGNVERVAGQHFNPDLCKLALKYPSSPATSVPS